MCRKDFHHSAPPIPDIQTARLSRRSTANPEPNRILTVVPANNWRPRLRLGLSIRSNHIGPAGIGQCPGQASMIGPNISHRGILRNPSSDGPQPRPQDRKIQRLTRAIDPERTRTRVQVLIVPSDRSTDLVQRWQQPRLGKPSKQDREPHTTVESSDGGRSRGFSGQRNTWPIADATTTAWRTHHHT